MGTALGTTQEELAGADAMYNQFGELPPVMPEADERLFESYIRSYIADTRDWCNQVYERALEDISNDPEIARREHYLRLLWGKQWKESRASYKPSPVVNRFSKWFWESLANLSDIKLNFAVTTTNRDFRQTAKNLEIMSQASYRAQRGLMALLFKMMHARLAMGFTKVTWNKNADDVTYTPDGAETVLPILGSALDLQASSGVVYTKWYPTSWFYEHYSIPGGYVTPETPPSSMSQSLRSPAHLSYDPLRSPSGDGIAQTGAKNPFAVAPYQEFWFNDPSINLTGKIRTMGQGNWSYRVAPFGRLYPFKRLIATVGMANRKPLYDNTNPHWHARFPFSPLRLGPTPWTWSGMSAFRDLESLQTDMNLVLADALYVLRQIANPTMITRDGSMPEQDWLTYFPGKPLSKLILQDKTHSISEQLQFIRPDASAIQAALPLFDVFKRAFDEIAGSIDITKIANKKQMPGEGTIDAARELQQARYRIEGIFVEDSVRQEGALAMADCAQFYTRARTIEVLGPDNVVKEYFDYDPLTMVPDQAKHMNPHLAPESSGIDNDPFRRGNAFVRQFMFDVGTGSSVPSQRRATAQLAEAMRGARDLDHEHYIQMLQGAGFDLPDSASIMENLKKEEGVFPVPQPHHGRPKKVSPRE